MISLKSLVKPQDRAKHLLLYGEGGIGKTTLGCMFPSPVVIRTEDGSLSLVGKDVQMFPVAQSSQDVFDSIKALATEEHEFKTLVLDSITQLNVMLEAEILEADKNGATSINNANGGFGAGYSALANKHREVREWTSKLSTVKNMNIIYLAHAELESMDLPDQDSYSRYSIRMHKKSVAHYTDNVDLVGYVKLQTFVQGEKKKRAISDGSRIITCYPTPSHLSKNRLGITQDIEFNLESNPFEKYL